MWNRKERIGGFAKQQKRFKAIVFWSPRTRTRTTWEPQTHNLEVWLKNWRVKEKRTCRDERSVKKSKKETEEQENVGRNRGEWASLVRDRKKKHPIRVWGRRRRAQNLGDD